MKTQSTGRSLVSEASIIKSVNIYQRRTHRNILVRYMAMFKPNLTFLRNLVLMLTSSMLMVLLLLEFDQRKTVTSHSQMDRKLEWNQARNQVAEKEEEVQPEVEKVEHKVRNETKKECRGVHFDRKYLALTGDSLDEYNTVHK